MLKFIKIKALGWSANLVIILAQIVIFSQLNGLDVAPGNVLFTPITFGPQGGGDSYTRLIGEEGEIINQWDHSSSAATTAYLLKDSTLLCPITIEDPYMVGSAYGGKIVKYSWHGEILWQYDYSNVNYLQHHDIEPMPNGNILLIAWDRRTYLEGINAGRVGLESEIWPDKIVELQPIGQDSAIIVWEWKFWDHLIQDVDPNLPNYGVVSEHPELIDINIGDLPLAAMGIADWTHLNSIDYNEEFDQIVISSRNMSEFYIIDHSTTTEEAASHSGGNSGMGGDIIYRWGNPMNYQRGTIEDKYLVGQHDVNWMESGYPNSGNLIMFNNGSITGFGQNYTLSSVIEISPPIDSTGAYTIDSLSAYGPEDVVWSYQSNFFSHIMSGAKRLLNGNSLVTVATEMRIFEVNPEGEIVWDYTHSEDGQTSISKAHKYTLDYLLPDCVSLGDINQNCNIDVFDIILAVNFILNLIDLDIIQIALADLNNSEDITIEDILLLVNLILS